MRIGDDIDMMKENVQSVKRNGITLHYIGFADDILIMEKKMNKT